VFLFVFVFNNVEIWNGKSIVVFLNINNYIKSLKNIIQTIRHNDLMKSIFFCQKKSIEICVLLLIMILFSIFLFTLIGSDD